MEVPVSQRSSEVRGEVLLEEVIASEPSEKLRLIDELIAALGRRRSIDEQERFRYRLCLDEAIENALEHGNRNDPSKKVAVTYFEDESGWGVQISDEGDGFDPGVVPNPRSEEGLYRESGRGIFIMTQFMSRVEYFDEGRTVRLYKQVSPTG